jgi:hypothetical protein
VDVAGQIAAHGNFDALYAVHAGIATRAAARDRDFQARHEAQVHEMFRYRKGEFHIAQDGALAELQVSQGGGAVFALFLTAAEYEVENHFQFQLYSNSFPGIGNDQSHSSL